MADKTQLVLDVLATADRPLSISEISTRLTGKIAERTLQRLLGQLSDSGKLLATGKTVVENIN